MNVGQIQDAQVGFLLFDMWMCSVKKSQRSRKAVGSPLVAAAADAFEQYIHTQEIGNQALIAGAAAYTLNPGGSSVKGLTQGDMAPFLALNAIA